MLWAGALNNIGYYHAYQGQYEDALRRLPPGARGVPWSSAAAAARPRRWTAWGTPTTSASQHDKAVDCYRQALDVLRELDSRCDQATLLTHLGDALATAGDQGAAPGCLAAGRGASWTNSATPNAGQVRSRLRSLG